MNLAEATLEAFATHVGEQFRIGPMTTTLLSATAVGRRPGPNGRQPFSLEFLGPAGGILPQQMYGVDHADLGAFELFVVPVASDADGVRYEAVFT